MTRDRLGDGATRVLLAVVAGARTWQEVERATRLSHGTVTGHLHRLRRDGLVAWEPRHQGTIRALVAPAPRSGGPTCP